MCPEEKVRLNIVLVLEQGILRLRFTATLLVFCEVLRSAQLLVTQPLSILSTRFIQI